MNKILVAVFIVLLFVALPQTGMTKSVIIEEDTEYLVVFPVTGIIVRSGYTDLKTAIAVAENKAQKKEQDLDVVQVVTRIKAKVVYTATYSSTPLCIHDQELMYE